MIGTLPYWVIGLITLAIVIALIYAGNQREKKRTTAKAAPKPETVLTKEEEEKVTAAGYVKKEEEKPKTFSERNPRALSMTIALLSLALITFFIFPKFFPGLLGWVGKFFIEPFPWGLLFVAALLASFGGIFKDAMKGKTRVMGILTVTIVFIVVIQLGRLIGGWTGSDIFGSGYGRAIKNVLFVDVTESQLDSVYIPLQKESYTLTRQIRDGEIFTLISITPVNANVSRFQDNGYLGFNKYGAVADTGRGPTNIDVVAARKYQAKLFTRWRNRPANDPVEEDEIDWDVPLLDNRVPYGALLVELDSEKHFLKEGETLQSKSSQSIWLHINLERERHRLATGGYIVKFKVDKY